MMISDHMTCGVPRQCPARVPTLLSWPDHGQHCYCLVTGWSAGIPAAHLTASSRLDILGVRINQHKRYPHLTAEYIKQWVC